MDKLISINDKEIVYWGIGNICEHCLVSHSDIEPALFIDTFSSVEEYKGKRVLSPDQITDWSKYFVVITTIHFREIENILEGKQLKKGVDFCDYKTFFKKKNVTTIESIEEMLKYKEVASGKNVILIYAPMSIGRAGNILCKFFKEYIRINKDNNVFFVLSNLGIINKKTASETIGCVVFETPEICNWNNLSDGCNEIFLSSEENLNAEELKWLESLEERKVSRNKELSYDITKEIYCYCKNMYEILQPSKVLIWWGWARMSYILKHLACQHDIDYISMEHGWIPGTIQFDLRGIAGQSIYAVNPNILNKIMISDENIQTVQRIKELVITQEIDTRSFNVTEKDEKSLKMRNPAWKTIFLVGMDEKGMGMNPKSEYWKEYISPAYESMEQVLNDLIEISRKQHFNLIYKPHPGNQLAERRQAQTDFIYVKEMSVDKLIQISDVVVSMSSAVEYKALMYDKPLVQVGKTGLNGKGCTYELQNRRDLETVILEAVENGMTDTQKRNYDIFLAQLLNGFLWDDLSSKEFPYGLSLDKDFWHLEESK